MDTTTAYHETRLRMSELFRGLDPEVAATTRVACCPEWTVTDLAAHVTGVAADIMAGRLEGVGTNPWTEIQVSTRQGRALPDLIDEWDTAGAALEAAFAGGTAPEQLVFDTVTHEHDLRHAIGRPGAQDHAAIEVGLGFVTQSWPRVAGTYDVPPLRVTFGDRVMVVGEDPEVSLHLSPFEVLRSLTGRRSLHQIRAYDWGTDPEPWLPAFTWGPFTPTATDTIEA